MKRTPPKWKEVRREFLGIDTWSGPHYVEGFSAMYEVTEFDGKDYRTRRDAKTKYNHEMTPDEVTIMRMHSMAQERLRAIAERKQFPWAKKAAKQKGVRF